MATIRNKTISIDENGEIIKEKKWIGYDGWTERGYRFRYKSDYVRYYVDNPSEITESSFFLLICLSEIMDNRNLLIYKTDKKTDFFTCKYLPYSKSDIRERLRYKIGKNKFERCWSELLKKCIKRIKVEGMSVFAINPAYISRCKEIPYWLYEPFQDSMNPYLTPLVIKKYKEQIKSNIHN